MLVLLTHSVERHRAGAYSVNKLYQKMHTFHFADEDYFPCSQEHGMAFLIESYQAVAILEIGCATHKIRA